MLRWALILLSLVTGMLACGMSACEAKAQTIPGPADAGRVDTRLPEQELPAANSTPSMPDIAPVSAAPENAASIHFTLESVQLRGAKSLPEAQLAKQCYEAMLGQQVSLEQVWGIAPCITQQYRDAGYFLTRAYLPAQEIENGTVRLRVVEGFIGELRLEEPDVKKRRVVRELMQRLLDDRPANAKRLEETLLRLNDIPGYRFRAVLEPLEDYGREGETRLVLMPERSAGRGLVELNNYGSRFLGPYQGSVTYQTSLAPLHQTTVSALTTLPADELRYIALDHQYLLAPEWRLDVSGSYVDAHPGYTLEVNDIDSRSVEAAVGAIYQPVMQRDRNLRFLMHIGGKNTDGEILGGTPLTSDHIRVARLGMDYDRQDSWRGYNRVLLEFSQGLPMLGASDEDDPNLSRAGAKPDFSKFTFTLSRQQVLTDDWTALGRVSGQLADGSLYSSEEFGYGGQFYGRAYDPSELTGDNGLAGALELQYTGIPVWHAFYLRPYVYYDLGKVWNRGAMGIDESASSAGGGLYFSHRDGVGGTLGLAWPLTREVDNPLGSNAAGPRLGLQLQYMF